MFYLLKNFLDIRRDNTSSMSWSRKWQVHLSIPCMKMDLDTVARVSRVRGEWRKEGRVQARHLRQPHCSDL